MRLLGVTIVAITISLPAFSQPMDRKDRVIFELTKPIEEPANFNWYVRDLKADSPRREHGAHQVMWEPLFLLDYGTGEMKPWLAEKLEPVSSDKLQWRLTLRKGVEWSDSKKPTGAPERKFTADDVLFTVRMVLDNDSLTALEAATLRAQVRDVKVANETTVDFFLRRPNPRFKLENFGGGLFGSFLIMPRHIWQDAIDKKKTPDITKFNPKPIGTGPYVLKEAKKDRMVWERNKDWWGAKTGANFKPLPIPLQLEWRHVVDTAASKALLEKNDIDAAREYALADFAQVKGKNSDVIGWDNPNPAWNDPCARQLEINIKYEWGTGPKVLTPWSDPRLRRALSLLIDRTALSKAAYGETAIPSRTMFADYGAMKPFIEKAVTSAGYELAPTGNPTAADTQFVAAGYAKDPADKLYKKGGDVLTATIIVNGDLPGEVKAANELGKQMTDGGVRTTVTTLPAGDYWGNVVPKGLYEMAYGWLSCGSVAEPYTSMSRYLAEKSVPIGLRSPGYNNTGRWDTAAAQSYSAIVKKIGDLALDDTTIPDSVKDAYQHLNAEMPFIPLVQSPKIIPFSKKFWTGWPNKAGTDGNLVPMHSWSAAHRLIHQLKKAP